MPSCPMPMPTMFTIITMGIALLRSRTGRLLPYKLLNSPISVGFGASKTRPVSNLIQVHERIQQAQSEKRPVVALESTIVSHGMPYPENLELCKRLSAILRDKGVEPATVAVRDGVCRVGLTLEELADLAQAKEENRVEKCSTRELSLLISKKDAPRPYWGATTVASTMVLANAAGIPTFVTGGIGGVHRNGQDSLDISADLTELSRTPTIVVSAGIKSILDIRRTLEVLETNCVPAIAYQSDEFPAFFSPTSGIQAPSRMDTADQIANAYLAARELDLAHGMLVGIPNHDPAGANVEQAIQDALLEASEHGISGQAVTPFILKRVAELTKGDSLRSNMALVENNAHVGAEIAVAIAERQKERFTNTDDILVSSAGLPPSKSVVVIGGIILDVIASPANRNQPTFFPRTSNPARCTESDGGVGRNVAETLGRMGSTPLLYSAVGNDSRGMSILDRLLECNVAFEQGTTVTISDHGNTATYLALLDSDGDLNVACADTDILSEIRVPSRDVIRNAEILILDGNPSMNVIRESALIAKSVGTKVCFEPTSHYKAAQVSRDNELMSCLSYAFPNIGELHAMASEVDSPEFSKVSIAEIERLAGQVVSRMNREGTQLVVTLGERGVLLATKETSLDDIKFRHFEVTSATTINVENATGAGDSLCGGVIHAILQGKPMDEAVKFGMEAARLSLECKNHAVSPDLSKVLL